MHTTTAKTNTLLQVIKNLQIEKLKIWDPELIALTTPPCSNKSEFFTKVYNKKEKLPLTWEILAKRLHLNY